MGLELSELGVECAASLAESVQNRLSLRFELINCIFVLFSHVLVDVFLDVAYAEELVEGFESSCDYVEFFAELFGFNLPGWGQHEGVGADFDSLSGALYEFSVSDFYSDACDFVFEVRADSYDFAEGASVRVL